MQIDRTTLRHLAEAGSGEVIGDGAIAILDVTHDSRMAGPDDLFVAIRGDRVDGHDYVGTSHAAAACVEAPMDVSIPLLVVPDTRAALPRLAAEVHGHPSRHMQVVGITGTNGKTTVAHLIGSIIDEAGDVPGIVGSLGARIGPDHLSLERTSPEASDLQRLLRKMVDEGVVVAAVEVSSHALVYGRSDATDFAVVAFTNLSQDHLDFHGDLDNYFRAKASLFELTAGTAVVNVDDEWGRRLAHSTPMPLVAVGAAGEFRAEHVEVGLTESRFRLITPDGPHSVVLPLGGGFNVDNAVMAAACTHALGYPARIAASGLSGASPIPGRMEPVKAGQEASIIVDYAHTPDGIAKVLASVRPLVPGQIIIVVGAGGDRDAAKRVDMGRAASHADVLVVTSDNPRSEDPDAIIAQVKAGADGPAALHVVRNRRDAIARAIDLAGADDAVLLLGKGHEAGQEIAGRVYPFDDRLVAREVVNGL